MPYSVEALRVELGGRPILLDIGFALPDHGLTGIIGANGCGKTTLLRSLGGLVPASGGQIRHMGRDLAALTPRARARAIAMLPQSGQAPPGLTVRQLVARGRTPWLRPFLPMSPRDHAAVDEALARVGLTELSGRRVDSLSGGQRQRVWIALVLAQQSGTILLDEPLNFLDLPYQAELIAMLRRLRRDHAIVMILHDLTIAARICDRVLALRDGQLVASGAAEEVLTEEVLSRTFGIGFDIGTLSGSDRRVVLPAGF